MRVAVLSTFLLVIALAGCDGPVARRGEAGPVSRDASTSMDVPGLDAPGLDAPGLDAPGLDAPGLDAPASLDAAPRDVGALPCDARFAVAPSPARAGVPLAVSITDGPGYVYIGLVATGPGSPIVEGGPISGMGPYTWSFTVRDLSPGRLDLAFTADMGATTVARCSVWVEDGALDAGLPVDASRSDAGPASSPPLNRFGIGFVGTGDAADLDRAADLAGPGGFVKLIFPGIRRDTTGPDPSWSAAIRDAYARDLVPVVRMGPPWDDTFVRDQADAGSDHRRYTALAAAYRRVVEGLPLRAGWPIFLEIHNEPNLCYEWRCASGSVAGGWISGAQIAAEYASMLRDVGDALHGIGDARVRVLNAGLAPGGVRRCECGTDGFEAGNTSLDFLRDMQSAVPDVFDRVDGFASHSYPAAGLGFAFFVSYDRAAVGLHVFERELDTIGRPELDVFLTETGWCRPGARCGENGGSRDEIAAWTEQAYREVWLTHPRVRAVMPFILRDAAWDDFAWMDPGGAPYRVYTRVRALRCATLSGRCP